RTLEGGLSIADRVDVVAGTQQLGEDHPRVLVVLDHQDERLLAPPTAGRGLGRWRVFSRYLWSPQPRRDAAGDFVGRVPRVVRARFDGARGIVGHDHDGTGHLRELTHGDGAG